ncbi:prepilin-type N-terminal cleavage/methylation domain-containing protein [Shewanella sp. JBTF-M18]|uniref:Type II secretion system protein H n=1 Tax=Shewanella insulae TaxID=2681496 RepID=A0A6L7HUV0_9GAMM|nr:GspH/FimT family pseudopilin [Shewanella insulae]MXR68097.1 prepilin-type N-terminal cleavage/methylation domain-containing protein [Shewanella insulae]
MIKNKNGFTLVELMVTIVVAGIILTIGLPSLISAYESVRVNRSIERIHNLMSFARNQAISYGTTVNVCPFASTTSCGTGTDWKGGIRVYITDAGGTDKELRAIDNFNSKDSVKGSGPLITFSADGLSSSGSIIYCPNGKASDSQSVTISSSGLISYGADGNSC